jgi:ATP-binding cassette subfamily C protein
VTAEGGAGAAKALFRDYRDIAGPRFPLALALMLAGAIAEGFGILMIVPLVAFAVDGAQLPSQLQFLADITRLVPPDSRFLLAIALFLIAMILRSILLYARDMLLVRLQSEHEASMQVRAAATLAARGWSFAAKIGQAGMQALLINDLGRAALAVTLAQQAVVAFAMLAVQVALAFFLSPTMTLIALAIILLGYALSWRWIRKAGRTGTVLTGAYDESTAAGFRLHAGLKAALAQGTVPQFIGEYRASLDHVVRTWTGIASDSAFLRQSSAVAAAIAASLLLVVGARIVELPFALLLPLLVLFARMSGPAQALQQSFQAAAVAAPAFGAVEARIGPLPRDARMPRPPRAPLDWTELKLDRVGFEHVAGAGLRDASLVLAAGEWVGIGGASGAGKTTLLDLVAGLLEPQQGVVRVDGAELSGPTLERWRDQLAYLGQGDLLFDDSVRGNLVADGVAAPDADLWAALGTVGLAQRIAALPAGLDQQVGDRGSSLSGGERQRLALARALLRKPRLLILDEATSALDGPSEAQLIAALRALQPRPAAILVAHRDATLATCDRQVSIVDRVLRPNETLEHRGG